MTLRARIHALSVSRRLVRGLLSLAIALFLVGGGASSVRAAETPRVRTQRVIAYYFHTTQRCASCRTLEAYSREAIESAFADQLKDGRLVWRVVNTDVKGNEHFVKDYALYTKSLVLVSETRGKPARWKNLEKVWQLLQDKPAFLRYVQDETRSSLGPLS